MMNGKSANFDRRLTKLESSKLGVPANLAGFRIPKIVVHEGDDVDQIIKDMEARGEIPPLEGFPAGRIRVTVHRIVDPPKRNEQPRAALNDEPTTTIRPPRYYAPGWARLYKEFE